MLARKFIFIAVIASFLCGPMSIFAQDAGALLDLLVRKKLITDQEAEDVRSELTKESFPPLRPGNSNSPRPSPSSSSMATRAFVMNIAAAKRRAISRALRAIGTSAPANVTVCASVCAERWWTIGSSASVWKRARIRARPTSPSAMTPDHFGKTSDGVNVGQAYIGYRGFKDITLTFGKMPNPLVTTLMIWDARHQSGRRGRTMEAFVQFQLWRRLDRAGARLTARTANQWRWRKRHPSRSSSRSMCSPISRSSFTTTRIRRTRSALVRRWAAS